jgi:hypothetical protein
MPRPFRIWLYPLPPLLALGGFVFILFSRTEGLRQLWFAGAIAVAGCILYMVRARRRREWPFQLEVR